MCGIAGYFGKTQIDQPNITQTLSLMVNRGPDFQTFEHYQFNHIHCYFLFSRLNIIDLHPRSNQPFHHGSLRMIFNGEIYNYQELKQELLSQGFSFQTESDTEVLIKAYQYWGEDCFDKLEGMWAIAIFDANTGRLLLSRDRFGEKPLYLYETQEGLYFASEVKFLKALSGKKFQVNYNHVRRFLVNGYKSLYKTKETFFENIKELESHSHLIIDADLNIKHQNYWQPQYNPTQMNFDDALEGVKHYLFNSIKLRLRADVPLAFCLSGGIDSTSVISIAKKIHGCDVATYSIIDSDERYNELENIQTVIDDVGCKSTLVHLHKEKSLTRLRDLIAYHDAPIATLTYYVHSFLSEKIAQDKRRVVFSGTSADEIFTGYYDHFNMHLYEMRNHPSYPELLKDWQEGIGQFVRNPFLKDPEAFIKNPALRSHIYLGRDDFLQYLTCGFDEDFYEHQFTDKSLLRNRMLNELFKEATPPILREDDLNSMKFSIENRCPYLDRRLFEFCNSIPDEHLIKHGYGKYLLRLAVRGILHDKVRLDKRKRGFNASILSIIDFNREEVRQELLSDSPVFEIFRKDKVSQLLSVDFLPNSYSKFLFNFINTKIFLELNS